MGRQLIVVGLIIAAIGLLMTLGLPLGRLPGDFTVKRGSFTVYVPLATSVLLSLALTVLVMLFARR